jgi:toxin ParE1/3/4
MGYSLSRKAEEDILGIYFDGIQHFGLMQADRYHRQLEEVFEFLAENPRVARERTEITPPVRIHPFRAHLVVYLVDESEQVFIVRVRHGHEDWQGESGPQLT